MAVLVQSTSRAHATVGIRPLPRGMILIRIIAGLINYASSVTAACSYPQSCGNISSIPYPFSTTAECGLPEFQLNCVSNASSGLSANPALFLGTSTGDYQITSFNNATKFIANVTSYKAMSCDLSPVNGSASFAIPTGSPYALSGDNFFFVQGCRSSGNLTTDGEQGGSCETGCVNTVTVEYCLAYSCCSIPIDAGIRNVSFYGGGISYAAFNNCGFSSIIYPASFVNPLNGVDVGDGQYGVELHWAIPAPANESNSCQWAQKQSNYSCVANTTSCQNASISRATPTYSQRETTLGYTCVCNDGYEGDGYKNGSGCTDIDECLNSTLNQCAYGNGTVCTNIPGSYICSCKSGYSGDGRIDGSGCSYIETHSNSRIILIAVVTSTFVIGMIILISAALIWKNRRLNKYQMLAVYEKFAEFELKPTLYAFSELQKATRDFHVDMKLGEGGFGAVYKGRLIDGSVIAVKRLSTSAQQSMDEFLNEVVLLTGVKHRNLVKLKGCCLRGSERLLVYEYVENYDLADVLFDHKGIEYLTWQHRSNICLGIAQGLHYLHALVEPRIIHRDIKASNVLLDKTLQPKIADFGLALLYPNETTHITMVQVAGTKGYLAPEYATIGKVSEKVDVFSFGVLVLEIVSGRRNIDLTLPPDQAYLMEWAWRLNDGGNLMELVDPAISLQNEEKLEVQQVINVALACIQTVAERRPTMFQVVAFLQGEKDIGSISREGMDSAYYQSLLARLPIREDECGALESEEIGLTTYTGPSSSNPLTSEETYNIELSVLRD